MSIFNLEFPPPSTVTLTRDDGKLLIAFANPPAVEFSMEGIQGPSGVAVRYLHTQSTPATSWTVNHNLGFTPQVEIFSVGGVQVEASVTHTSVNQTVIAFNTAQAGQAVFN